MSRRITRNSYKRKVILVGIMLFMAITLISTGFAAWVISTGAGQENAGGVEVGVVTGVDLKMELAFKTGTTDLVFSGQEDDTKLYYTKQEGENTVADTTKPFAFSFEPLLTDTEGRVRYQEGDPFEVLSLTVSGTVTPGDFVNDVVIKLTLPAGVVKAIEAKYITINETFVKQDDGTGVITLTLTDGAGLTVVTEPGTSSPVDPKTYSFSKTLEFGWGEAFGEMNPSIYYDTDATGKTVSTDDVIVALKTLRAVIYGYDGEADHLTWNDTKLNEQAAPIYGLSITANIN